MIEIYTDGACSGNPGPGGVGILMLYKTHRKEFSIFLGNVTNNIAELTAIKYALEKVKDKTLPITIYTDSEYSIGSLTKNWKAKKNQELIHSIKSLMTTFSQITFVKVKGHSNNTNNNYVDALAREAIQYKRNREHYFNTDPN